MMKKLIPIFLLSAMTTAAHADMQWISFAADSRASLSFTLYDRARPYPQECADIHGQQLDVSVMGTNNGAAVAEGCWTKQPDGMIKMLLIGDKINGTLFVKQSDLKKP